MALTGLTVPLLDDFNRANEIPLSVATNWTRLDTNGSLANLSSNQVSGGGVSSAGYVWTPQKVADCEVAIRVGGSGSGQSSMGVVARVINPNGAGTWSGYEVFRGSTNVAINRYTNGTSTNLTNVVLGYATAAGDYILMRCIGDVIQGWVGVYSSLAQGQSNRAPSGWILAASVTDSTYTNPGFMGMTLTNTTAIATDFYGGTPVHQGDAYGHIGGAGAT